jgi:ribose 5-phosphate isomerase B
MLALANDHGGYALALTLMRHLDAVGVAYRHFGTDSDASVDYPDFAKPACLAVASGECERGILICGTGIGMSIAANKVRGIRAALCHETFSAEMTRRHNDANVLCLGARVTGDELALRIVDVFLATDFDGGRHAARVAKLENDS